MLMAMPMPTETRFGTTEPACGIAMNFIAEWYVRVRGPRQPGERLHTKFDAQVYPCHVATNLRLHVRSSDPGDVGTQRTREIGILRAMGTRRGQMLRVFLVQGAVLGLVGSLLGALAGLGLVGAFNTFGPKLFYIPLPPALIPAAMALATVAGVVAAAVPASRAAKLDPVEAIRHA